MRQCVFEAARDRCVVRIARAGARIDDEIHCGQFMLMLAERFPDQALDAVARTASQRCGRHIANPRRGTGRAGVARKYREKAVGRAARITIHAIEFGFLPRRCAGLNGRAEDEPRSTSERERRRSDARSGSDSETLATLRAAPCENLTAALAVAMRARKP